MPERAQRTHRQLLASATEALRLSGVVESPAVDARRIVETASGLDRAELALVLDEPVRARAAAHLDAMVERRCLGEPLQYVVGSWSFRTLDLFVDRRVLIPRPETEQVVERALQELDRVTGKASAASTVVDLGTGSGAIALAIAAERPAAQVWAMDVSADALSVARANLAGLGTRLAPRVRLLEGSWFEPLPAELRGAVDLVVANPPYVAADEELPSVVRDWEPTEALLAGATGLEALEVIVGEAPGWLRRGGALVSEIGIAQAAAVTELAVAAGFTDVDVYYDLTERPRILAARG